MRAPRLASALHVARNDVRLLLRDRGTVFWSFLGPIIFMFFFGVMFKETPVTATRVYLHNDDASETLAQAMTLLLQDEGVDVRPASADTVAGQRAYRLVIEPGAADSLAAGRPPRITLQVPNEQPTPREQTLRAQTTRALMGSFMGLRAEDARAVLDSSAVRARVEYEPRVVLEKRQLVVPRLTTGFQRSVPAYIVMFLLMTLFTSGAEILILERRAGLLRRTLVASVSAAEVILGKFLARFGFAWLQIAVMLAVGAGLFRVRLGEHPGVLLVVLLVFALAATGLGLFFATLFRNPDKAGGVGVLSIMATSALGGCWWPLELVPSWMAKIAWALPTGWGFDALNRVMALDATLPQVRTHLLVLGGVAALTLAFSARRLPRGL